MHYSLRHVTGFGTRSDYSEIMMAKTLKTGDLGHQFMVQGGLYQVDPGRIAHDALMGAHQNMRSEATPCFAGIVIGDWLIALGLSGANFLSFAYGGTTVLGVTDTYVMLPDPGDIKLGTQDGTKIGTHPSQKLGFWNATPVIQPDALTAQLTAITHTAPGTPDYAIGDLTQTTPYGFTTQDEGNTVLSVVANLQTRVAELEAMLQEVGFLP